MQRRTIPDLAFVLCLLLIVLSSCASRRKPFEESNKIYERQVDSIAEIIKQTPPPPHPAIALSGLAPKPMHEGQHPEHEWVGTVNFNMRKPNFIILHHTAQDSVQQTLRTFTVGHSQVSAHYLIGKDGKTYQLLNDYLRAWHAGTGKWGNITDLNSISIGIELDNNGYEPYTEEQINNLLVLLDTLQTNYNIPKENVIGHADISPGRKIDPNINFPWKRLADRGFGLWYDEVLVPAPPSFNPMDGLRILGYDTSNPSAAIIAFKRHFIQTELSSEWTPFAIDVLYNLYHKR